MAARKKVTKKVAKKTAKPAAKKTSKKVVKKVAKKTSKKAAAPEPAAETASVKGEVSTLLKLKKRRNETDAQWRGRLVEKIDAGGDELFDKLSDPAQEWYNDSVRSMSDGGDAADFPGDEAEVVDEADEADEIETAEEPEAEAKPTKKGRKVAKKTAGKKAPSSGGRSRGRPAKAGGAVHEARKIWFKNPEMTREELATACAEAGVEIADTTLLSTFSSCRSCHLALKEVANKTVLRKLGIEV